MLRSSRHKTGPVPPREGNVTVQAWKENNNLCHQCRPACICWLIQVDFGLSTIDLDRGLRRESKGDRRAWREKMLMMWNLLTVSGVQSEHDRHITGKEFCVDSHYSFSLRIRYDPEEKLGLRLSIRE